MRCAARSATNGSTSTARPTVRQRRRSICAATRYAVRTLILDGGSLLSVPVYERLAVNAARALRVQFARCSAELACRRAFPKARSELPNLLRRRARQTQVLGVADRHDRPRRRCKHGARPLARGGAGVPMIPEVIHRAARGDYVPLAQEFVDRVGADLDARARLVMSFEILCSKPWARFDPASVLRSSTEAATSRPWPSRAHGCSPGCAAPCRGA